MKNNRLVGLMSQVDYLNMQKQINKREINYNLMLKWRFNKGVGPQQQFQEQGEEI